MSIINTCNIADLPTLTFCITITSWHHCFVLCHSSVYIYTYAWPDPYNLYEINYYYTHFGLFFCKYNADCCFQVFCCQTCFFLYFGLFFCEFNADVYFQVVSVLIFLLFLSFVCDFGFEFS